MNPGSSNWINRPGSSRGWRGLGHICGRRLGATAHRLAAILLLAVSLSARGQGSTEGTEYVVDNWQTDAGLPHATVTALVQTRDRYLWLGTSNGLARFDGVRFSTFRAVDNPGLRSNRILCLYQDRAGRLWVGTDEGGLACYEQGQFTSFTTAEGLAADSVLSLGEDRDGTFWVGTALGLSRRSASQAGDSFRTEGLADDTVNAVCQPRLGPVLFATQRGLYQFRREQLVPVDGAGLDLTRNRRLACLLEDKSGRLWAGGEPGVIQLQNATALAAQALKIPTANVMALMEDQEGGIWFGTKAGELLRALPGAGPMEVKLVWRFGSPVLALCEDHEGSVWVGTAGSGLGRLKRRQLRWIPFADGANEARVFSTFETTDGELWLLGADRGLYRYQKGRLAFRQHLPLPEGVAVQCAGGSGADDWWIGTAGDGLFECRAGFVRQFSEREGISDSEIVVLCPDPQGGVWLATRNGGLNYLKAGVIQRFNTPWGFMGNCASALARDRDGRLWIGTGGDGLYQLTAQKQFIAFTETNGLPSSDIRALLADPDGVLWIGTAKGLCRAKQGFLTAFPSKNSLGGEAILQLRSDTEGHLWVGGGSGIYRLNKEQLNACAEGRVRDFDVVPYGKEDGLPGVQCVPRVQAQARPGPGNRVWFATARGLVVGDAKGWRPNTIPPPVLLEAVLVENESVPVQPVIRVAPGKESLQFQYTALSLAAPGKVCFRYRLEGFDRDWSETTLSRAARYPKVPPGDYRFQVVARNNDGVWNEVGASVALAVMPFWWATLWFRLGLGAAVALALIGLYRLRQARRREMEALRVRIASDLHDDVGSSLWSITLLSRMLARQKNLVAEQRQDVEEIQRIAVQTSNSIRDIIWLINPAFDTLQDLVLRMKDFAGTTLRGIDYRMQCEGVDLARKLPLDFRQNLFLLIKEALTNIARHAHATEVQVRIEEHSNLLQFEISDNGVGFDPTAATAGNGLKNLRARSRKMGAELAVHSQPGHGSRLVWTALIP